MLIDFLCKLSSSKPKQKILQYPPKVKLNDFKFILTSIKDQSAPKISKELMLKYKGLYRIKKDLYIVSDADFVARIMKEKSDIYHRKGFFADKVKRLLGYSSFTIEGEESETRRKIINQLFSIKNLKIYANQVIHRNLPDLIKRLEASSKNHNDTNIFYEIFRVTYSAITKFLLNYDIEEKNLKREFSWFCKWEQGILIYNDYFPTLKNLSFYLWKRNFLKLIKKMFFTSLNKSKTYKDMADILQENIMSETEEKKLYYIIEELRGEIIAGMTTTTVALGWAIYHIYKDQRILFKLREELSKVLDGEIKYEDIGKLDYCKAIVNESLRMYPPVGGYPRYSVAEDTFKEYMIKKNSCIMIDVYSLHRNPEYWDNPDEFYPERFIDTKLKHKSAYIPFSYGHHTCVGNRLAMIQMILSISTIVSKFNLKFFHNNLMPESFLVMSPPPVKFIANVSNNYN